MSKSLEFWNSAFFSRVRGLCATSVLASSLAITMCAASFAAEPLTNAIGLYQKKDYRAAAEAFRGLAQGKDGATAHYYMALCYIHLGYAPQAKTIFDRLIRLWPDSPEARMASDYQKSAADPTPVVNKLNPYEGSERDKTTKELTAKILEKITGREPGLTKAQWEALPQKTRIPIERANGHLWVRAKINGQYCRVIFDTGATICTLSTYDFPNLISKEELRKAKSVAVGRVYGVVEVKQLPTDITIQDVSRRLPTCFIDEPHCSVIGQNFFKEYSYQVDDFYLRLTKAPYEGDDAVASTAGSSSAASGANALAKAEAQKKNDKYSLPFEKEMDTMLVDITVNGHPIKACFDTGCATNGLVIHPSMARELGIGNPSRIRESVADRVVVGHMIKMSVPVNYAMGLTHPLIGPKVFDRGYTVDQQAKRIRFDY